MLNSNSYYNQFSDGALFSMVKENDNKAFEEIYSRYWCFLVESAFKRLQFRQKAEDIVQNIFIDLYQRRHSIDFTVSLKAYLSTALKFKVLNEFRSEGVRSSYLKSLFFRDSCKNDFSIHIEAKELDQKIEKLLSQLPEKCKNVFVLSRTDRLSNKEIANGLNISISTVEKHISKALKSLRANLKISEPGCYSSVM